MYQSYGKENLTIELNRLENKLKREESSYGPFINKKRIAKIKEQIGLVKKEIQRRS